MVLGKNCFISIQFEEFFFVCSGGMCVWGVAFDPSHKSCRAGHILVADGPIKYPQLYNDVCSQNSSAIRRTGVVMTIKKRGKIKFHESHQIISEIGAAD